MKKNLILILIFLVAAIVFVSASIDYNLNKKEIPNSEEEIINDCKDLGLEETAFCLRDNVKTFYNYSVTNEKYYDLNYLKEKGGDCYNYAVWYDDMFRKLGFNSKTIHIENGEIDHRITIVSSEEGYCLLDLLNVKCWLL